MESLDQLLTIDEALKLDKKELFKFIRKFMEYTQYCGSYFVDDRFNEWCGYLHCKNEICTSDLAKEAMGVHVPTTTSPSKTNCGKVLNPNSSALLNGTSSKCFDAMLCLSESLSKDYHYLSGVLGCVVIMICLFTTLVYIKGFLKEFSRRNTAGTMLVLQAVFDVGVLVLLMVNKVSLFCYYTDLGDIIQLYAKNHVHFIKYTLLLMECFNALSLWIIAIFTFDRFNYLIHGKHYKKILTQKAFLVSLAFLMVLLVAFMVLKSFTYSVVEISHLSGYYRLVKSELGNNKYFFNLTNFWLKMPLESLLPLGIIFIFLTITLHQMIFSGRLDPNKVVCYEIFQEFRLTRSIILISVCILISEFSKLVLHILINEIGVQYLTRVKFELICTMLQYIYYVIKCCGVYPYMCPIYFSWLMKQVCFESGIKEDEVLRKRIQSIDSDYDCKQYLVNQHSVNNVLHENEYEKGCKYLLANMIDPVKGRETVL